MPNLAIKTKDNSIYSGKVPIHSMLCDRYKVKPETVVACGIKLNNNRIAWSTKRQA